MELWSWGAVSLDDRVTSSLFLREEMFLKCFSEQLSGPSPSIRTDVLASGLLS